MEVREGGDRVSLAEVGKRLGRAMRRRKFSAGAVSEWEAGNRTPDVETMAALAKVTGVRAEWLAFGTGPMIEENPAAGRHERPVVHADEDAGSRIGPGSSRARRRSGGELGD